MSEGLIPAAEAGAGAGGQPFDPKAVFRSVAISLVVNGVLPFVLYKILAPYFPPGSVMPLLYASAFPVLGLGFSLIRTRSADAIALFALFGIFYSIATMLLAGEVRLALILGATQAFLIAGFLCVSAVIGRPVVYFIVRQFAVGNDAVRRIRFAAVNVEDGGRTFYIATMVWAAGMAVLGGLSLMFAVTLAPATYLLVNNIVNTAVNVLLVVWTIRFVRPRLTQAAARLAAS
jgi:hypothetical protein